MSLSVTPATPRLVLASASPRRMELLRQIGVSFTVVEHQVDEAARAAELPQDYVQRLALEKARSAQALMSGLALPVLGADTIVVCAGQILGKPRDREDAMRMWRLLSGVDHQVYSAVALCLGERAERRMSCTQVRFRALTAQDCEHYWASGEPVGKAGAYAIQGLGALFVQSMAGSYTGVVGLPLFETAQLLAAFGVPTALDGVDGSR
jgi:septum formation protein